MVEEINLLYIGKATENIRVLSAYPGIFLVQKGNSLEAVNYIYTKPKLDAIICEMYLSGWSGLELHEWVREKSELHKLPFILVVYEFKEELFRKAFLQDVDDFFVVPLPNAERLINRIQFLIGFRSTNLHKTEALVPEISYNMPMSKRVFDVVVAATALIALSPLLLLMVIAIRFESKGKVYYTSKRVGREPFDFYKLRSMRTGADSELNKLASERNQYNSSSAKSDIDFSKQCPRCRDLSPDESCSPVLHIGPHAICDYWYTFQKKEMESSKSAFIKIADDPRITRVGKIIRNTSIDELPQLINVIKGDMSIVGNRPLPVYEAEQLTKGYLSKRFLAPAGITGLWQVELRGKGGVMSEEERKRLDNEYADHFVGDNYSFWYDLKLILRTVPALFQKDTV
jgi:lipopolysaccharide/colanic/teichoic acid biosynthesis glycosyltransferase